MIAPSSIAGVLKRLPRPSLSGTGGVLAATGLLLMLVVAWLFLDGQSPGSAAFPTGSDAATVTQD